MKIKAIDYKELFKMKGQLTCLHSEFLVKGSLGLGDALIVCKQEDWRSFINIKEEKKCLKKGYEIFSNQEKYSKYKNNFLEYINNAKKEIIPKYSSIKNITYNEYKKTLPFLGKLWYYYGMTEFSYHEFAYEKLQESDNKILKKNLDDLGKLKFKGRKTLNSYIFENGALINFLRSIGKQFFNDEEKAFFLFSNELNDLFNGKKISNKIIDDRKKYYGCATIKKEFQVFSPKQVQGIWKLYCNNNKKENIITGTIANKGLVKGKVVIAPMLVDMKEINKIDKIMKKNDILVAESTTPELMMLCQKAAAIVTDQGGMLSHAAIISREMNIPCVIGTSNATEILKNGDIIEVDANNGVVKILQ